MFTQVSAKLGRGESESKTFYPDLAKFFETLAYEERLAAEWAEAEFEPYPDFGNAKSSYDPTVKSFYASWNGFKTRKKYSWVEKYRTQDAPDRRVRRLMEKENKKLSDDAMKDFNDTVQVS